MKTLVFDIGGTLIKYALVDNEANIYDQAEFPTPTDSLESLLNSIEKVYYSYKEPLKGIALSMPGNINADTGHIDTPGALMYNHNVNIIDAIKGRINTDVAVENDGKSAALAEVWKGNLEYNQSGILLVLGSGIGGAIVHNREVIKGNNFFAGEVSFMMTDSHDFSFENVFAAQASTIALVTKVAALKNIQVSELDGYRVFEMIHEGDTDALQAFDVMTTVLAIQIYNLQCLLDPEKILIGGGVSRQPILIETINRKLDDYYSKMPIPMPRAKVSTCRFFNESNIIGAMYNFLVRFDKQAIK